MQNTVRLAIMPKTVVFNFDLDQILE